jgi:hypothetical protein
MTVTSTTPPDKYTVFISHRTKDKRVAHSIKTLLSKHTANIDYFVSEEIEKGERWRQVIIDQLQNSHFLILVITDPDENWHWCMYETGFFDALTQNADHRRIYCLHHPDIEPPTPITDLQTTPARPEEVIDWLNSLFDRTQQQMNDFRREDEIPKLANEICKCFADPHKLLYSANSINIEVDSHLVVSSDDLPANSFIYGDNGLMAELFGANTGVNWKSVKTSFDRFPNSREVNLNALKEIARAVHSIFKTRRVPPLQSTIFVGQGPKRYRPVISHVTELSVGRISCAILLIEEAGGPLQNVDKPLGALLTAMRTAIRIRWEIVRPFVLDSNTHLLARNARKLRFDLQTCFNNIFIEADYRGNFSETDLWRAFEGGVDRQKLEAMMTEWDDIYDKIWHALGIDKETFSEVSAQPFKDEDICSLQAGMRRLEVMNRDFLDVAVARAKVLVQEELAKTSG